MQPYSPFDLHTFIARHVIKRDRSMLEGDIAAHRSALDERIRGRKVLVIGGAGSIGSAFIREILRFHPGALHIVDKDENGLTEVTRDLRSTLEVSVPGDYRSYPLDFGSQVFAKLFRAEAPYDIVANFAAHKHVRSEKDHYAIEAMIQNNIFNSRQLLDLLADHPPAHFFCVSTDKATNPVSVMGATKKLMEEAIFAYRAAFKVTTARFANVAFSQGSLPFGFLERLKKRQPLSAPRDVRRYFVSPEESGQICLLSCILGNTGEILFPKLGEGQMATFAEIGSALLAAHGLHPVECRSEEEAKQRAAEMSLTSRDYPVYYFDSDTSGEKDFEEFYSASDEPDFTRFEALGVIRAESRTSVNEIHQLCDQFQAMFASATLTKADIVAFLKTRMPEFAHKETGRSLDNKM